MPHTLPPRDSRWFEDYVPGASYACGSVAVDERGLVEFARRYDPQAFHIDPEAAAATPYGGLIASGWHTCALAMRLLVEHYISAVASLGSPGIDELRWLQPVRPGDRLAVTVEVVEARVSRSKPDRGLVRSVVSVANQHGTVVMSMKSLGFFLRRPGAGG